MNYLLKRIDKMFWRSVKVRAAEEGMSIREVILTLLEDWLLEPKKR